MRGTFRIALSSAALLLLGVSLAQAMMPPWVYEKARNEAPYHIQVAVEGVKVPSKTPGDCEVSGKIVSIFRDTPGNLADDEEITFPVACIRAGDEALIGGTIWTDVKELLDARYIEVYLVDEEDGFNTALWQSQIIDEPSSTPQFRPE